MDKIIHIIHIRFFKKTAIYFLFSFIFCTFAVQKNNDYLCLKTQDLSAVPSSPNAIFLTSSPSQPGWN